MMFQNQRMLISAVALGLMGCNGTFWANWIVLAVTVGIFFGTLSLGKASHLRAKGDGSQSKQSHHS